MGSQEGPRTFSQDSAGGGAPLCLSRGPAKVLVSSVDGFLRYLDVSLQYLTVSPRISLHLLASPRICPYLPVSRISWYLPVSPGKRYPAISPAISRHIPPRIPRKEPASLGICPCAPPPYRRRTRSARSPRAGACCLSHNHQRRQLDWLPPHGNLRRSTRAADTPVPRPPHGRLSRPAGQSRRCRPL